MRRPASLALLALAALLAGCPKTGVICTTSEVRCGNTCANLQVDPSHCGSCGSACAVGFVCSQGQCVCPPTLTACGQACVDVRTNAGSCGACGHTCGANEVCDQGACATQCSAGRVVCGAGSCVDPLTDRVHCGCAGDGGADLGQACGQGSTCVQGACQPDLVAACFNSGELFSLDAAGELASANVAKNPPYQPVGLAFHGPRQLEVADLQANQLLSFDVGATLTAGDVDAVGNGVNAVAVAGDLALVVASTDHALDVLDLTLPAGARRLCPADGGVQAGGCAASVVFAPATYPQYAVEAPATDGGQASAFVSLQGDVTADPDANGNKLARVGLGDLQVHRLTALPGENSADLHASGTQARPQGMAVVNGKLYVALANLQLYTPTGPGLVAIYTIPADLDAPMPLETVVPLGPGCVNAGAVLPVGNLLFVLCGPKYAPDFTSVAVPGALAGLDLTSEAPAFAPHPFDCPAGAQGCKAGGASRMALAGGKLFIGDSIDGRLFTADPATGNLLRGPANALPVCLAPDGGLNYIVDVAAPFQGASQP